MIRPQLAKAGELPVDSDGWLFEVKWDGYRCIAVSEGDGKVTLQSRSGKSDYNAMFPHIVEALSPLPECILDGELVVLDGAGNSDFGRMDRKAEATFVVFDCLKLMSVDMRDAPLTYRKDAAAGVVGVLGSEHVVLSVCTPDGANLLEWAEEQGIEGIVAKRAQSKYREGARNGDWLKIKLRYEQEFAVLGWTPGEGAREGAAGSLLLAVFNGRGFDYCGRVGTGGDLAQWQGFAERPQSLLPIAMIEQGTLDMMDTPRAELRDVTWVEPFVVQVKFQRWTDDNDLWHPSLVGVRVDKDPSECRRESR